MKEERVYVARTDMCRFGMVSNDDNGKETPVRTKTGFMTNSYAIAKELAGDCHGDHGGIGHQLLVGGRAPACAVYPAALCRAIGRGIEKQKRWYSGTTVESKPMTYGELSSLVEG